MEMSPIVTISYRIVTRSEILSMDDAPRQFRIFAVMNEQLLFRRAAAADIPRIMRIIARAQAQMRAAGSLQWQDGYPAESDIARDIGRGTDTCCRFRRRIRPPDPPGVCCPGHWDFLSGHAAGRFRGRGGGRLRCCGVRRRTRRTPELKGRGSPTAHTSCCTAWRWPAGCRAGGWRRRFCGVWANWRGGAGCALSVWTPISTTAACCVCWRRRASVSAERSVMPAASGWPSRNGSDRTESALLPVTGRRRTGCVRRNPPMSPDWGR